MIDALISHFEKHITLNSEEIDYLRKQVPIINYDKQAYLLREGNTSMHFFFVIKGCVRMFYEVEGIEKTAFFYTENDFISAYESFTKQLPSKSSFQAIEQTQVAGISVNLAADLLRFSPKFAALARIFMEEELIIYQQIISSFITLNAEQRYQHLLTSRPDIVQRVPLHYLATYLGVSPETLSRIRKRIQTR